MVDNEVIGQAASGNTFAVWVSIPRPWKNPFGSLGSFATCSAYTGQAWVWVLPQQPVLMAIAIMCLPCSPNELISAMVWKERADKARAKREHRNVEEQLRIWAASECKGGSGWDMQGRRYSHCGDAGKVLFTLWERHVWKRAKGHGDLGSK